MQKIERAELIKAKHNYTLTIENDIYAIEHVVSEITSRLKIYFSDKEIFNISLGLSELITNAVEHGNLEISYDEKTQFIQDGIYFDELERRCNTEPYKNRKVTISYTLDNNELKFVIKDDGSGFDWKNLPSPESILSECHGRGITITRHYFDEISFNEIGNEVTLIKKVNHEKN